jgi:hypothetical protein
MNARPFTTLADEMLSDLGGYINRLSADTCPDLKARLRADVADTGRKRGPVHQDAQCQITECVALPCQQIAVQYDSRPAAFSPRRWKWISESFAGHFDCDPEDVDLAETEAGDFITVKGAIVGFVRTRIG